MRAYLRTVIVAWVLGGSAVAFAGEGGWQALYDGHSLAGWKASENRDSISVRDGMIVCTGPRSHLFYSGPVEGADFRNFELEAEVMTLPGSNSGIYIHTRYQDSGWPEQGYEVQINNSHRGEGNYRELKKTGSLYGIRNVYKALAADNEWFTLRIAVEGRRIRVFLNEMLVVDYWEADPPVEFEGRGGRHLSHGTFAMQGHDAHSTVFFRSVRVRPLPDTASSAPSDPPVMDGVYRQILELSSRNFPVVDLHVHLKGGLSLEDALANSRKVGIFYGIAANCGLGFPITNDAGIRRYLAGMRGRPVFVGMQAEGREWVDLFSREAIEEFDYVFTDSMTWTDDQGRRMRLWIPEEVHIEDEEKFMDMLVRRIESIMDNEPIDIYVNPTFLPARIAGEYDRLWTPQRVQKVVEALARNGVAMEINSRYHLPSPAFIKRAKAAGVKFTLGTNNGGPDLGRLKYALKMIRECGLESDDMWLPNRIP